MTPSRPILTTWRLHAAIDAISAEYDVDKAAITGRLRTKRPSEARLTLYTVLHVGFETSYNEIASLLKRDHTTIMYGVDVCLRRCATDATYNHMVAGLIMESRKAVAPLKAAA